MRRIKHNDLLPWFLEDHGQLPERYVRACEKFFKSLKPQASSLTGHKPDDISRIIKEKL